MKKFALLNVVGLTRSLIGENTPRISNFLENGDFSYLEEPFPAVTCTSQASIVTGEKPSSHGVVGNGWYFKDLAEVGFWKQNNGLVQGPKLWDLIREKNPNFTCAKIFWWYNMYADVDWSITPRPHYPADGRKVFDVYTNPADLGEEIKKDLGGFPFFNFWGPKSGIASSQWIGKCAKWIFEKKKPDLNLVYLPHLDYDLQRYGPNSDKISKAQLEIDEVVGDLIDFYQKNGVEVALLSEYGITEVSNVIHPNRILREKGFLEVRNSVTWELMDAGASEAFAVADHQIAHVYVKNKEMIPVISGIFEAVPGNKRVLRKSELAEIGLNHERSGDIVLMAESNYWYTYYYWKDDSVAPDFARCVDIHRKPGYDPCELFLDPEIKFPKLKIMWTLLKKVLGFRYYMDVIPLKPELIKGSHGTPVSDPKEGPLIVGSQDFLNMGKGSMPMAEIRNMILKYFS